MRCSANRLRDVLSSRLCLKFSLPRFARDHRLEVLGKRDAAAQAEAARADADDPMIGGGAGPAAGRARTTPSATFRPPLLLGDVQGDWPIRQEHWQSALAVEDKDSLLNRIDEIDEGRARPLRRNYRPKDAVVALTSAELSKLVKPGTPCGSFDAAVEGKARENIAVQRGEAEDPEPCWVSHRGLCRKDHQDIYGEVIAFSKWLIRHIRRDTKNLRYRRLLQFTGSQEASEVQIGPSRPAVKLRLWNFQGGGTLLSGKEVAVYISMRADDFDADGQTSMGMLYYKPGRGMAAVPVRLKVTETIIVRVAKKIPLMFNQFQLGVQLSEVMPLQLWNAHRVKFTCMRKGVLTADCDELGWEHLGSWMAEGPAEEPDRKRRKLPHEDAYLTSSDLTALLQDSGDEAVAGEGEHLAEGEGVGEGLAEEEKDEVRRIKAEAVRLARELRTKFKGKGAESGGESSGDSSEESLCSDDDHYKGEEDEDVSSSGDGGDPAVRPDQPQVAVAVGHRHAAADSQRAPHAAGASRQKSEWEPLMFNVGDRRCVVRMSRNPRGDIMFRAQCMLCQGILTRTAALSKMRNAKNGQGRPLGKLGAYLLIDGCNGDLKEHGRLFAEQQESADHGFPHRVDGRNLLSTQPGHEVFFDSERDEDGDLDCPDTKEPWTLP